MHRSGILAAFASFALAAALHAQVSLGISLPQEQFLPGESLPVSVRITNFSGQILPLGRDNSWLHFAIESKTGYPVPQVDEVPVAGEFDLENASIATKKVDLASHFEQLRPGRYLLTASVTVPGRTGRPISVRREFDVINGTIRWERPFGVPVPKGENRPPEIRCYALQQANNLDKLKLYARITSQDRTRVFRVFPLGPLLTFSETEQQIDPSGRLHVLYQYGARAFYYHVINPDGDILIRQTHEYVGASRPRLTMDKEGTVAVLGGTRRPSRDDFPPPPPMPVPPPDTNAPPTEVPTGTNSLPAVLPKEKAPYSSPGLLR